MAQPLVSQLPGPPLVEDAPPWAVNHGDRLQQTLEWNNYENAIRMHNSEVSIQEFALWQAPVISNAQQCLTPSSVIYPLARPSHRVVIPPRPALPEIGTPPILPPVFVLPPPPANAHAPPPDFPRTKQALLSLTAGQLKGLLEAYNQPVPKTLTRRRAEFAGFIGVRLY
ncbi:hypothetical protein DFH06DRAFT_1298123 [Mycena polygramma]|nr:hypothetical protein DFH06DRAFT_1298123 [Mycena polygramma]